MGFDYINYLMNKMNREEKLKQKELAYRERQKAYKEKLVLEQEKELE